MSRLKTLRGKFALELIKKFLEIIIVPGRDPIPPAGTKMLDKRGLVWQVEGPGIRRLGKGADRWWDWNSDQAAKLGPLLVPTDRRRS